MAELGNRTGAVATFVAAAGLCAASVLSLPAQETAPERRDFSVTARKYAFTPARLTVAQDDLVKITFRAEDIPHSFTIDAYRIAKRAGAGQTVVFEFRADRTGTFPFYCNLAADEGCKQMHGELSVGSR